MKNILKYVVGCFTLAAFVACGDLYETHEKYLTMGEETYIGLADSLQANGGFNRVELKWMLNADPRISSCVISWNGCEKPLEVPADRSNKFMSKIIDLPEGKYIFKIVVKSESGKESLPQTTSGESYGKGYQARLPQKGISSLQATPEGVTISWIPEEGCIMNYLTYENKAGEKKKLTLEGDVATTFIEDFVPGSNFALSSVFKPEKEAIDIVESLEKTMTFPNYFVISKADWDKTYHQEYKDVSRTGWTVEASTQEEGGEGPINGYATTLLDGDLKTFWHSAWSGPNATPPLPHTITFDMKEQQDIISVELARRQGNKDTKTVTFSISSDNLTWTEIGTLDFPNELDPNAKIVLLDKPMKGRYLRTMVTASYSSVHASLSEIQFTSKKKE